jgi:diadenosine tetraphosphate (Ap4A) HIT family hydrolase
MLKSTTDIDPRLAASTIPVITLALSEVRLMDDSRFPWLVLVPTVAATELTDLTPLERGSLMEEVATVSKALSTVRHVEKINVGTLGNIVPQLHVHVVGRRRDDEAWPGPVWGSGEAVRYDEEEREALVTALIDALSGRTATSEREVEPESEPEIDTVAHADARS